MTLKRVTRHALDRFSERVTPLWEHEPDFHDRVLKWCTDALETAKFIRAQDDGKLQWRFAENVIVTCPEIKTVITIRPSKFSDNTAPSLEEEVISVIKNTVVKALRPLFVKKHEIIIEMHSHELSKLRVHNPQTKKIIRGRIDALQGELEDLTKDIQAHSAVGHKYGINIDEVME